MSGLSEREKAICQRLKDDYEHYALKCLKIRPKHVGGEAQPGLIPFRLNAVQQQLHARIEDQRVRTGRVRILVLKARQPGVSTYVAGRYFWKVTHHRGIRVFILTHRDKATANLLCGRQDLPRALSRADPAADQGEQREGAERQPARQRLQRGNGEGGGHSETIQPFHGSEGAFWANADEHAVSALQAVQVSCLRAFDLAGIGRSEPVWKSGAGAGGSEAAPAVRPGRDEERQAENRDR